MKQKLAYHIIWYQYLYMLDFRQFNDFILRYRLADGRIVNNRSKRPNIQHFNRCYFVTGYDLAKVFLPSISEQKKVLQL